MLSDQSSEGIIESEQICPSGPSLPPSLPPSSYPSEGMIFNWLIIRARPCKEAINRRLRPYPRPKGGREGGREGGRRKMRQGGKKLQVQICYQDLRFSSHPPFLPPSLPPSLPTSLPPYLPR